MKTFIGIVLLCILLRSDGNANLSSIAYYSKQPQSRYNYLWAQAIENAPEQAFQQLAQSNELYWLTLAAQHQNADAQWRLANKLVGQQQDLWLQQAAQNDYLSAQLLLAKRWRNSHPDLSRYWLRQAAQQDAGAALQLAELNWGNINNKLNAAAVLEQVAHWLQVAKQLGGKKASQYLAQFEQSTPQFLSYPKPRPHTVLNVAQPLNCAMQIQPVVSSLAQWSRVSAYIERYRADTSFKTLPMCFNAPVVINKQQLQCDKFSLYQPRLLCDEYQLATMLSNVAFSHILVMSHQGKANVHNGILYLDEQDSYKVMLHELAHFAGFIDEYPLSAGLAAPFCNKARLLPNLLIVKKSSAAKELPPDWPKQWPVTADKTLYKARTCDNTPYQAYKPFAGLSFMEFYDAGEIPDWYMAAWAQQINQRKDLIPAFVNFSQAAADIGDKTTAHGWWHRYKSYIRQ